MKYSVVVLIFHRSEELKKMGMDCVNSVKQFSGDDYELIVVDNGSTVRTDYWEKQADQYIRFEENKGISAGWNAGIKAAKGEYVVILGDDVIVRPGYLEAMHEALQRPNAGVSNPYVEHLPVGIGIVNDYKWFSGACFMLPKETIKKVGYFYEGFDKANFEDSDYWARVMAHGLKLYKNFAVQVQHKEGQTLHAPDISSRFEKNKQIFRERWGFDAQDVFCHGKEFPCELAREKLKEVDNPKN